MKPSLVICATALLCVCIHAHEGSAQARRMPHPSAVLSLHAATVFTETPHEQLARLESEYDDALARANELSARLDVMLADAKVKNASILERTKPICDQLGGTIDDSGTCIFTCPHKEPEVCDARTADFNKQAAPLIQEKQATMLNLKAFASLVRTAWTDAATKKQAWEQLQSQLEKH